MKISFKDFFKNPANLILFLVFLLSIIIGFLFVYRFVHEKDDDAEVNMKEIADNYIYYASVKQLNLNGEEVEDIVLVLDDKNNFTLLLSDRDKNGYVGFYTKDDSSINLFTNYYFSLNQKSEFKYYKLNINEDGSLVFESQLNNTIYTLKKCTFSDLKSRGFNNLNINVNDILYFGDPKTDFSSDFSFKSVDDTLMYIQKLNGVNISSNISNNYNSLNHLYGNAPINKYNLNYNIMLEFILPSIENEEYFTTDNINNFAIGVFGKEINFNILNTFNYNGYKYMLNQNKFVKLEPLSDNNINNNIIKRIYNYEIIDNKLYVYDILINYECSSDECKYYPHYYENVSEKTYFDFITKSNSIIDVLNNISKFSSYKWTFDITDSGNYVFESFQLN